MKKLMHPRKEFNDIYEITPGFLKENGIKGIVFDIDNTLVPYKQSVPDDKVIGYFKSLTDAGISTGIISNARKERVERFAENLIFSDSKIIALHKSGKPLKKSYRYFTGQFGIDASNMAIAGDQLFTDILGGNISGFYTLLVKPIAPEQESNFIKFKRRLEKIFYARHEEKN